MKAINKNIVLTAAIAFLIGTIAGKALIIGAIVLAVVVGCVYGLMVLDKENKKQ